MSGIGDNDKRRLAAGGLDTSALDDVPLAMVITDPALPDNPIVYVNDAFVELTGYARRACVGRNCRFLQGADTEPSTVKELREAIEAGDPVALDIVNYRADGTQFINSLSITPIRDHERIIFFLGVQAAPLRAERFDGDKRMLRQRLRSLQAVVEDQVGSVLKTVRGFLGEGYEADRSAGVLAPRVESIAQLYDGLYRSEAQGAGRVRLGAYLARVCSATHLSHREYNVRLNTHFEETVCDLDTAANAGLLLFELLSSAFKEIGRHPDDASAINIRLERSGGGAVLSVSDVVSHHPHTLMPAPETVGAKILSDVLDSLGTKPTIDSDPTGQTITIPIPAVDFPGREGG